MVDRRTVAVALVGTALVGVTLLAASVWGPAASGFDGKGTVSPSPEPTETDDQAGKPARTAIVDISPRRYNESTGDFRVDVETRVRGYENLSYEDPRLCLYDRTGAVLGNVSLWRIHSPDQGTHYERETVTTTVETRPYYVVVDHPELRNDSRFVSQTVRWLPDERTYWVERSSLDAVQDEFPFPRTNEVGACG